MHAAIEAKRPEIERLCPELGVRRQLASEPSVGTVVISGINGSRPASRTSEISSIDHGRGTHPSLRGTGTSSSSATGQCSHRAQTGFPGARSEDIPGEVT
jgi:hypothetical protein